MYKTDLYLCEMTYPLDELQRDILTYLYLPLVGSSAYSLYHFLYEEARRMDRVHRPCALTRITATLNVSLDALEDAMKMLEGIGLLRTLRKDNHYLMIIQSPLSLKAFYSNQVLSTLLEHTIGEEDFHLTRNHFRVSVEDHSEYEEITSTFGQIYSVDLTQARPLSANGHYLNYNEGSFSLDYDLTLFYESLKDYSLPMQELHHYDELFKQLAVLYSIDAITLANMVRESFVDHKLNVETLKKKARSFYEMDSTSTLSQVYRTQPEKYRDLEASHGALDDHLHYLETISPYQLLKNKQGGAEPVMHDLTIAETLMTQLHLTPGVTNVLLEYAMGNNDNRLSRAYCETIGAAWARKHIKTAKQAYNEAMKLTPAQKEKAHVEKKKRAVKKEVDAKASTINLDELLDQLDEGDDNL